MNIELFFDNLGINPNGYCLNVFLFYFIFVLQEELGKIKGIFVRVIGPDFSLFWGFVPPLLTRICG